MKTLKLIEAVSSWIALASMLLAIISGIGFIWGDHVFWTKMIATCGVVFVPSAYVYLQITGRDEK